MLTVTQEWLCYTRGSDVICFSLFYYVLCLLCLCLRALQDKCAYGLDKGEIKAEVNIRTTDGSDIVNLHHNTKGGCEYVTIPGEDK